MTENQQNETPQYDWKKEQQKKMIVYIIWSIISFLFLLFLIFIVVKVVRIAWWK